MFGKLGDKEKIKKLFKRFETSGMVLESVITFEKEPWYHYCYSDVIDAESRNWTFYIPAKLREKIENSINKKLSPGDRLLLQINEQCILIVKISSHETSFVFTIAEKKAKEYGIDKSSATKFNVLKVADYEETVNKIVKGYENGESVPTLESSYPLGEEKIRRILRKRNMHIRSPSEQRTMRHHGRLPRIRDGLTEGKLKIIFAMLGDNIGNVKSKGYKIGIMGDLDFTRAFVDSFEKEYGIRPPIYKSKHKKAFITYLKNKSIFTDLRKYAKFGVYDWRLLDNALKYITKMNPLQLGRAVAYFWEAEGCPIIRNKTIVATSVNHRGLQQIQKCMGFLKIKTSITGPNFAASSNGLYTIRVSGWSDIKTFSEKVNFVSERKRAGVEKLLASYKRFVKIHTIKEYDTAFELKKRGFTLKDISNNISIPKRTLKTWFYEGVKPRN